MRVNRTASPRTAYRVLLLVVIASSANLLNVVPSVEAIVNGVDASGDTSVVTLMPGEINPQSYCTGVYYQDYAVVTAAHCVVAHNGRHGEWRWPLNQWFVAQPSACAAISGNVVSKSLNPFSNCRPPHTGHSESCKVLFDGLVFHL